MMTTAKSWTVLGTGTVCALAAAVWASSTGGSRSVAQPPDGKAAAQAKYLGAGTCIRCHTEGPSGGDDDTFVLLTEYATWRTQDKHSLAYFALESPRGKQMAEALKCDVTKKEAGCLACHAMGFVAEDRRGDRFDARDGVSCDACHGPAANWLTDHQEYKTWRPLAAAQKAAKGMTDLRDPVTRVRVCFSCHVGDASEGKVVTHPMYAAGHPPLPNIEVALFSHNLPPHFRNKRDVPFLLNPTAGRFKFDKEQIDAVYHMAAADYQQSQLVAASSLAGLGCAMNFVAGRSDLQLPNRDQRWPELAMPFEDFRNREPATVWPQLAMAQSDCYACHHELQRPSWRQLRGYDGLPGRLQIRPWPLALVKQGIGLGTDPANAALSRNLAALAEACNVRPFGDPAKVAPAARALQAWADGQPALSRMQDETFDRVRLLKQLCTLRPNEVPDYDSARQIAAAIDVISNEAAAQLEPATRAALQPIVDALQKEFNLRPYTGRRARLALIQGQFTRMTRRTYLQTPGALEALEKISNHGLRELLKDEKPAIGDDVRAFLTAVRDQGGSRFTDAVLDDAQTKKEFLDALNKINETELHQAMKKVREYQPFQFKQQLEGLLKLLP